MPIPEDKQGLDLTMDDDDFNGSGPSDFDDFDPSAVDRGDAVPDEDAPAEEPPAEEPPAEEPPAEEDAPAEEPPAEEDAPAEEPPAEEDAPVEEPPVEDEQKKKKIMIPKHRLDDEIAKRRKLEARIAEMEKAQAQAETTAEQDEAFNQAMAEASALMKQANELVLDGELDKAAQLQQDALAKVTLARKTTQTEFDPASVADQIEARIELKATLKDIYRRFPQLNAEAEEADAELIDRAVMYESMYAEMGHSPAVAVERAVEDAVRLLRPELMQDDTPAKTPVDADGLRKQKQRQDLGKKVDMANKQPPPIKGGENRTEEPKFDINTATEEEWDALPEATKRRLRGDF